MMMKEFKLINQCSVAIRNYDFGFVNMSELIRDKKNTNPIKH